jgi:hypothetical protein
MSRTPLVYGPGAQHSSPARLDLVGHPVPVWWRGPEPDHDEICRRYLEQKHSPPEIAVALGISRARVDAALAAGGVTRRGWGKRACPLTAAELRAAVDAGATVAELAREHGVSSTAAKRWLADAGLLEQDPELPAELLTQLYIDEGKSTRQIAAQLHVSRGRLVHAMAAAGIAARGRTARHGGGNRGAVTDELLTQLYVDDALTLREIAARLSVTSTYVSRRVRELALTRRPGWFGSRVGGDRTELRDTAAELYEQGLSLRQVGEQLGVSSVTVTKVLHEAQVPIRRPGYRSREQPPRTLVDDLYADPAIDDCLRRFAVRRPGTEAWNPATPRESYAPLPLDPDLVRELYVEIGLSAQHVAMLCGLGVTAVRNRMADAGIAPRPRSQPCPWSQRRFEA